MNEKTEDQKVEGIDYVVCQICGKKLKYINWLHLRVHNISIEEYTNRYPNSKTVCSNLSKELNKYKNSQSVDEWIKENTNKHLCACGCGEYIEIKPYHREPKVGIPKYIPGHHSKTPEYKESLRLNRLGKVMSDDARNKMSIAQLKANRDFNVRMSHGRKEIRMQILVIGGH